MTRTKAALAVGAALLGLAVAMPATAQPAPAGSFTLSPAEQAALFPLKQAVDVRNWSAAAAALPAARAAARGEDARYAVARYELDVANGTQNRAGVIQAIINVLEQRRSPVDEQVELLRQYGALTYDAGNSTAAEQTLNRVLSLAPNDPEALAMLGQISRNRGNATQAVGFFQRAFRAAESRNLRMPESRYRLAVAMAEQTRQRPVTVDLARLLVNAYPSATNWRDALIIYRTAGGPVDPALNLDALRLMRASGALSGERDYLAAAQAADQGGSGAEAKAILEEGATRGMISGTDAASRALLTSATQKATRERTALTGQVTQARGATATAAQARTAADMLLAHGRYAEAAELYRLALTRPGEDPNLVNNRLGEALALAGQRAEAEAALRAVTGTRAELAAMWLTWLARRAA